VVGDLPAVEARAERLRLHFKALEKFPSANWKERQGRVDGPVFFPDVSPAPIETFAEENTSSPVRGDQADGARA